MARVRVQQQDGEVRLFTPARGRDDVYAVEDHLVEVADADLVHFLQHVDGSEVVVEEAPSAPAAAGNQAPAAQTGTAPAASTRGADTAAKGE